MNTYTWVVDSLDCIPLSDGQTNVVSCVHWRVNGTDGTHNATVYGTQPLTYTAGSPFTTYSALTKATVIGWVQAAMGSEQVASIQQNLDNQIANLANPPIVQPPLPWGIV
jgi:hypothetical protein